MSTEPCFKSRSAWALDSERRLEDWLADDLSLLGEELLLLGRQLRTPAGPLDLLAMDGDGALVIAELKRHRTPREVVAQVLDYASWIRDRTPRDIDELCQKLTGKALADAYREQFEYELPEGACKSHRMLIVAAELDDSSERIIRYLQDEHEIDINAVFFSVYQVAGQEVLVRAWLADPVETQERAAERDKTPWSGTWFANVGVDDKRDWAVCRKHGFISAGGGQAYSGPLHKLQLGARIAAYINGKGYVGIGTVTKTAEPADEFVLSDNRRLVVVAPAIRGTREDEKGEHVIGIKWAASVPHQDEAKTFKGVFANPNVVCKLRHAPTLEFLRQQFGV